MSDSFEIKLRAPVPLYLYRCDCGAQHNDLDKFWIAVDYDSGNSKVFCVSCQANERPVNAIDWSGYRARIEAP